MKKNLLSLHLNIIYLILYFTLIPSTSHSMIVEYRRLDCIPELQHYSFGESFLTEEWSHLEEHYPKNARKHLWDTHHMVHDTGWAYSIHPDAPADSTKFEDLEFFEHTCDIGLGIKTKIRAQARVFSHSMGAGRMMEQIQIFYHNKILLDSINEFGCYSFSDTECNYYKFGVLDIIFMRSNITIVIAISENEFKRNISNSKNYPEFLNKHNCDIYYLDIEIPTYQIDDGKDIYVKTNKIHSEVIALPLSREKILQIIKNEYLSSAPSYKEPESGEEIDQCYLKVRAQPIS